MMPSMIKENEPCINCDGIEYGKLYTGKDYLLGFEGDFTLLQCTNCGLITLHPKLTQEETEKFYPPNYLSFPIAIEDEKSRFKKFDRWYGREKQCNEVIKRIKTPGKILDIGCATGIFLSGMKRHGWDCYGVEPSAFAANYASQRFNLNIFHGYLENAYYPEDFFDVITLWDVLEHIPDPSRTLQIISKLLKPNGTLILNLPNAASWERFLFKRYWVGWDIPRHFTIFTPKTITDYLLRQNFSVNEIISFTSGYGALVLSVSFMLEGKKIVPSIRLLVVRILRSYLARIITYPFYRAMEHFNKTSFMTIFAQNNTL